MKKEIAIIGYGRFGKLAAHHFKKHFRVSIFDTNSKLETERGIKRCTINDLSIMNVIVLAVPVNKLQSILKNISPFLKPNSLVIDVCAVKEQPIEWMKKYLPKQISILGTHPLFGPDNTCSNLRGKNIVLCPVRISKSKLKNISNLLSSFNLDVTVMSPKEHDKLMASTLFLTQFIGRGLSSYRLKDGIPKTENFKIIERMIDSSNKDSNELFLDIYGYNRYARRTPSKIISKLKKLNQDLDGKYSKARKL